MPALDATSLIFSNALLSLVVTAVLLLSRIGLGDAARGVRTWVVADLFFAVARGVAVAELLNPRVQAITGLGLPVVSGALVMVALVGHLHALKRVAGQAVPLRRIALQSTALALLFAVPAAFMATVNARVHWMGARIVVLAAITRHPLWPMRRLWGARLIGAMMVLAMVFQGLRLFVFALHFDAGAGVPDAVQPPLEVAPLLIDLIVSLFVTTGFMLLLQEQLRQRIERLVVTDALTGVLNRHGLMAPLERELAQAVRHGRPLSVVMFDLDHFKRVNDEHGHATGDLVLAGFAARATRLMRGGDLFGRWGGEEFLLVLPDTAPAAAWLVAERLRADVAQAPVAGGAPPVTVSGGVASAAEVSLSAQALLQMLELADQRLYQAKRQRNQVVAAPA